MPDLRLVGLHELRALIKHLNEANLRVSSAHAHLFEAGALERSEDLDAIKVMLEDELLPTAVRFLKELEGGTLEN